MNQPDVFNTALHAHQVNISLTQTTSTDSTNMWAERELAAGTHAPFALLADSQSTGVGQHGRQFDSPSHTGLYLSTVLALTPPQLQLLMPAAGVAASEACKAVSGITPQLKWVNDLFVGQAKLSGILTWLRQQDDGRPVAILGWGLNLTLPQDRKLTANQPVTGLWNTLPKVDPRPQLIASFLANLTNLLDHTALIMPAYRQRAMYVGRQVHIDDGTSQWLGTLTGFADNGNVIVRTTSGTKLIAHGTLRCV